MKIQYSWIHHLDPDQQAALKLLLSDKHSIIPSSDQKSNDQLMLALILEVLASEGRIVIVADEAEQRQQIQKILEQHELASLSYLKNDNQYISSLRVAKKKNADLFEVQRLNYALRKVQQNASTALAKSRNWHQSVFASMTRLELSDRLASHKLNGIPNVLDLKINISDFEGELAEYQAIRSKLSNYIKLRRIDHPFFETLAVLNFNHLKQYSLEQIKKDVTQHLQTFIRNGEECIRSGEKLLLDYIRVSKLELQQKLNHALNRVSNLSMKIESHIQMLGNEFVMESSFSNLSNRIRSNFQRSSRVLVAARREVKIKYLDILDELQGLSAYIPENEIQAVENLQIDAIQEHLVQLQKIIGNCEYKMQLKIREQIKRLNSKNVPSNHILRSQMDAWEQELEELLEAINSAQILQEKVEVNALSVEKKLFNAGNLVRELKEVLGASDKLEDFIFWQSFQENLPATCKDVIKSLEFENTDQWVDIFDEWYFRSLLDKHGFHFGSYNADESSLFDLSASAKRNLLQLVQLKARSERHQFLRSQQKHSKLVKSAMRKRDIESFTMTVDQMTIVERSDLFPIQIVTPQAYTREFGLDSKGSALFSMFVLGEAGTEMGTKMASTCRESTCRILTAPTIAKRIVDLSLSARKVSFLVKQLHRNSMQADFNWQNVPSSDKLVKMKNLASQFKPLIKHMRIYNAKKVQIFSFMGSKLDSWILDKLGMPYKVSNETISPTIDTIVENLLDNRKPIVILYRDEMPATTSPETFLWQNEFIETLEKCGIPIYESLTDNWIKNGMEQVSSAVQFIQQNLPERANRNIQTDRTTSLTA